MKTKLLFTLFLITTLSISAQYTFNQIDIWSGTNGSSPRYITQFDNQLYFQAFEITPSFKKLYKSDGTDAGTNVIATNLNSGAGYSPESLTPFKGELFFTAFVSGLGIELYKTDGTDAGTVLIKDIRAGGSNGLDQNTNNDKEVFVEFNNELYFRGSTNSSIELWKTDGTNGGTTSVKNFEEAIVGAPEYISNSDKSILGVVYNNELFFSVSRGTGIRELWKTDGTTAGTIKVRGGLNGISELIVFNNLLYFKSGTEGDGFGAEVWVSDGTTSGTVLKFDLFPNSGFNTTGSDPSDLFIFNNELYFSASAVVNNKNTGRELWKTDGVTASLVKNINTTVSGSNIERAGLRFAKFKVYQNELYFIAKDGVNDEYDLWKTDGTETGTIKVVSANDAGESFEFSKAIEYNGKLFYFNSQQLWVTDATSSGTTQLTSNNDEILLISTSSLELFKEKLWFAGTKTGNGEELTSLSDNALSIDDSLIMPNDISIYPNPANNWVHIKLAQNQKLQKIVIYNVLGEKVLEKHPTNFSETSIHMSSLEKGVYMLKVKINNKIITKKMIVRE